MAKAELCFPRLGIHEYRTLKTSSQGRPTQKCPVARSMRLAHSRACGWGNIFPHARLCAGNCPGSNDSQKSPNLFSPHCYYWALSSSSQTTGSSEVNEKERAPETTVLRLQAVHAPSSIYHIHFFLPLSSLNVSKKKKGRYIGWRIGFSTKEAP